MLKLCLNQKSKFVYQGLYRDIDELENQYDGYQKDY